jgi:hypothetical protein
MEECALAPRTRLSAIRGRPETPGSGDRPDRGRNRMPNGAFFNGAFRTLEMTHSGLYPPTFLAAGSMHFS